MTMEYTHFALPSDSQFRPNGQQLSALISALISGGWLSANKSVPVMVKVVNGKTEFRNPADCKLAEQLQTGNWELHGEPNCERRLLNTPCVDPDYNGNLVLCFSEDYVLIDNEILISNDQYTCQKCQRSLRIEYTDQTNAINSGLTYLLDRASHSCPDCNECYNPSKHAIRVQLPSTGDWNNCVGRSAFRFAVAIEFESGIPEFNNQLPDIDSELSNMLADVTGVNFLSRPFLG